MQTTFAAPCLCPKPSAARHGGRRNGRFRTAFVVWAVLALAALWSLVPSEAGALQDRAAIGSQSSLLAGPSVASASGILVDAESGKILWAKNDRSMRAPASLTKVLTALVVLERADLQSSVTITPEARAAGGSRTYAEAGWKFSVEDLLYGLLLPSGNDAAIALAQKVSPDGTVAGFVNLLNQRAAQLGASSTHFSNPHGLDEPVHLTTARDMALITLTALRNPTFAAIVATQRHTVRWGDGTQRVFQNHNKLLGRLPGTIGVKTGYTVGAKHTLASAVRRDGNTLVAVTLGSPTQYDDSIALFNWAFPNLSTLRSNATEDIWPAPPAGPQSVPAPAGSNLIGNALRLLQSVGPVPRSSGAGTVPVIALSSVMGATLALAGFNALRNQRRYREDLALMAVRTFEVPASGETPYVSNLS